MRASTVESGQSGPQQVTEVPEPHPGEGAVLAEGVASGMCGTDKEIGASTAGHRREGNGWCSITSRSPAASGWSTPSSAPGVTRKARGLFDRLLDLRNDVGLLSEEYDPATGKQVGNTPQAFSMVGLFNSARQLTGSHTTTSRERQHLDPHRERPAARP